mgnify:CR=1 FL=1
MRYFLILVILTLPIAADAQQRARGHRPSPTPRAEKHRVPAQFKAVIPTPWPDAGRWRGYSVDMSRSSKGDRRHHGGKPGWGFRPGGRPPLFGGGHYAVPYSGYYAYEDAGYSVPPPEAAPAAMSTTGVLRLEITPATGLQYYIDGMFIGSSSDLGTQFEVNAGARRIEIRAEGYKPVVFDARFNPGETITRHSALERVQAAAALPRATGSTTMFVIPGCFMGNARPDPSALPKGCDIRRLTTRAGL